MEQSPHLHKSLSPKGSTQYCQDGQGLHGKHEWTATVVLHAKGFSTTMSWSITFPINNLWFTLCSLCLAVSAIYHSTWGLSLCWTVTFYISLTQSQPMWPQGYRGARIHRKIRAWVPAIMKWSTHPGLPQWQRHLPWGLNTIPHVESQPGTTSPGTRPPGPPSYGLISIFLV